MDILNADLSHVMEQNGIDIPTSGGGHFESIGPDLYAATLPDGRQIILDGSGNIKSIG